MHIPDGYLSPSTCAALYTVAAPFWYVALGRVKKLLSGRAVPLLGLFAAFSFVIMMFNLPLPGGTTGHAVGMGMASIVLGPWVSMIAISMALLIQALFFGDGGITSLGANCFNMAIVGSIAAYAVYRLISGRTAIDSKRRVVAAALGGYCAINLAALFAAIEFGVQPMLFRDASGAPLYAPYPLSISIPAMMIGHLTFAGLAEMVVSAGVVAYLQRADPELLLATAPGAILHSNGKSGRFVRQPSLRVLWAVLAVALILTPLGILAVGSAWGEWRANDFESAEARQQIATASRNSAPPVKVPEGLERLSSLWTAPLPQYAPPFLRSSSFGYFVSGSIGVGIVLLLSLAMTRVVGTKRQAGGSEAFRHGRKREIFFERTLETFIRAVQDTIFAEEIASAGGLLQHLDARVKLAGIGTLILSAIAVRSVAVLGALFLLAAAMGVASRVSVVRMARRVWMAVLAFTGVIAVPALFLVPGRALVQLPLFHWTISVQGLESAALLVLRAETCATFAFLLVLSTQWNTLLRTLRWFRVPATLVFIAEMTYRYLFLFLQTAQDMIESRRARLVGRISGGEQRKIAAAMAGVLLDKSLHLSTAVYEAMSARGFRGEIRLINEHALRPSGWFQLSGLVAVAVLATWMGR